MSNPDVLTEREADVLRAVIGMYVETAGPAGSRSVAKRYRLGVSPATVRNTMADLEEKGFLYHPHTSAGRVPTDRAFRYYVNSLMRPAKLTVGEQKRLRRAVLDGDLTPLESLIRSTAQALGLLTGELGVAVGPRLEEAVLEKLELVALAGEKLLLLLTLRSGAVRTIYVDLPFTARAESMADVTMILNERLAGQTLRQIRHTLPERLRDASPPDREARELLNVFLQTGEGIFDWKGLTDNDVHLGRASVLAQQPEFASGSELRNLIELTERRDLLVDVLRGREHQAALEITIGKEHGHPELSRFTVITSEYNSGSLSGVIGVIGPTRMPYEKVAAIVERTSGLLSDLLSTLDAGEDTDVGKVRSAG